MDEDTPGQMMLPANFTLKESSEADIHDIESKKG